MLSPAALQLLLLLWLWRLYWLMMNDASGPLGRQVAHVRRAWRARRAWAAVLEHLSQRSATSSDAAERGTACRWVRGVCST